MDKEKCWEHVDKIINFMDKGFRFLAPNEILDEVTQTQKDVLYDDPTLEVDEQNLLKNQKLGPINEEEEQQQLLNREKMAA